MQIPEVTIRRYSGYRIRFLPQQQQNWKWAGVIKDLTPYVELFDMMKAESFYVDDLFQSFDSMALMNHQLRNGEVFLAFHGETLACLVIISDIIEGRDASFEGWSNPKFRGSLELRKAVSSCAHELLGCQKKGHEQVGYAFTEFGDNGLGLKKLKCRIAKPNQRSLKSAYALGFRPIGVSELDALHQGVPYDAILLELKNPAYFGPSVEILPNVSKGRLKAIDTELHTGSALHVSGTVHERTELHTSTGIQLGGLRAADGPEQDSTASVVSDGHSEPGSAGRIDAASVAPVEQQPIRDSAATTVSGQLLPTKRRARARPVEDSSL